MGEWTASTGSDIVLDVGALPPADVSASDRLWLAPGEVHVATVRVPRGASIASLIGRLAPIDPDALRWAVVRSAGGRTARIAMVRKTRIAEILTASGVQPWIMARQGDAVFTLQRGAQRRGASGAGDRDRDVVRGGAGRRDLVAGSNA